MIRASGKKLSTIYISHGDPDFYFGLDTVLAAFPDAKVVASEPTVRHIKETVDGKLAYWGRSWAPTPRPAPWFPRCWPATT